MNKNQYNGWTNYETWNANLWMTNDSSSQEYWNEQAQEIWENSKADDVFTREEQAACDLAECLKSYFNENMEEFGIQVSGMYADLLNAALSEINWHEIAEHLLGEIEKEEEGEIK